MTCYDGESYQSHMFLFNHIHLFCAQHASTLPFQLSQEFTFSHQLQLIFVVYGLRLSGTLKPLSLSLSLSLSLFHLVQLLKIQQQKRKLVKLAATFWLTVTKSFWVSDSDFRHAHVWYLLIKGFSHIYNMALLLAKQDSVVPLKSLKVCYSLKSVHEV